jgi:hypothetical protein
LCTSQSRYRLDCRVAPGRSAGLVPMVLPYYMARRMPKEDARQIKRWKAIRRHIAQIKRHCETGDPICRPRQRQTAASFAINDQGLLSRGHVRYSRPCGDRAQAWTPQGLLIRKQTLNPISLGANSCLGSYSDEPAQFVGAPGARNARCRSLARRSSCNLCSYAFLHDFEQNRSIHFRCTIKPN